MWRIRDRPREVVIKTICGRTDIDLIPYQPHDPFQAIERGIANRAHSFESLSEDASNNTPCVQKPCTPWRSVSTFLHHCCQAWSRIIGTNRHLGTLERG
jgi:hypothetical protein